MSPRLTTEEVEAARVTLLKHSQMTVFSSTVDLLKKGKELPINDPLLAVRPLLGDDGLLRVGGRLCNSGLDYQSVHPIILHRSCWLTCLLVEHVHRTSQHAGPATMLSILSATYFIQGVKRITKSVSRNCVTCRRAYAQTAKQLMGQLPAD